MMIHTKIFALLGLAANFAFDAERKSTAPTFRRAAPSPIFVYHFATTNTLSCYFLHALSIVMCNTKALCAMRLIAERALASWKMNSGVFGLRAYLKILNSIIGPIPIFVMANFCAKQWSFKKPAHYKSVFWNPAVTISIWMVWFKKQNIASSAYFSELFSNDRHWSIMS